MKIGTLLEGVQQGGRGQPLVHDQIRLAGRVEVVGDVRLADRQDVDRP